MRTALVVMDGVAQIVFTPETEIDHAVVKAIAEHRYKHSVNGAIPATVYEGSFYHCRGGWIRQGEDDKSLILVLASPEETNEASR